MRLGHNLDRVIGEQRLNLVFRQNDPGRLLISNVSQRLVVVIDGAAVGAVSSGRLEHTLVAVEQSGLRIKLTILRIDNQHWWKRLRGSEARQLLNAFVRILNPDVITPDLPDRLMSKPHANQNDRHTDCNPTAIPKPCEQI